MTPVARSKRDTASVVYVAFLRGINVGGKNIVSMASLKANFERIGLQDVSTYINSGNVLFRAAPIGRTRSRYANRSDAVAQSTV